MPYRLPDLILHGGVPQPGQYPLVSDPESEIVKLAKVWDARGLLYLFGGEVPAWHLVRVFNNFKNLEEDRQIGDRRGRNYCECQVPGPSKSLPAGSDLLDLHLDATKQCFRVYCTDRKDFYHQFWVTESKAASNAVGPSVPLHLLRGLRAYDKYMLLNCSGRKRPAKRREEVGDGLHLGGRPPHIHSRKIDESERVHVCFKAIFQGDHAGVEIATGAHEQLLKSKGLLVDCERIVSSRPFSGGSLCQGLVIDDYFAISREERAGKAGDSLAADCFAKSQEAYDSLNIKGSPHKDVLGECRAKIIGAEINSFDTAGRRGITTLGSPLHKRLSLSQITLQLAQLRCTTDVLHLCLLGGWTSALMFRRPLMSLLSASHRLVDAGAIDSNYPKLVPLPRSVADELVVLAALAPLAVADLGADFASEIFATDASENKGAIVSAECPRNMVEVLWRSCRSKGAYTRLRTPYESLLQRLGLREEGAEDLDLGRGCPEISAGRPIAFKYHFIEVYAGSSKVSQAASRLGLNVGPPIDIAFSKEMDMAHPRVISWLSYLMMDGLLSSIMVEPVCISFSMIRRPPLRSRQKPFGYDPRDRQTFLGNLLALRALCLLQIAYRLKLPGLAEQPWTSMMRLLPSWSRLEEKERASVVRADSCSFGSVHLKSFRFLAVNMSIRKLDRRCSRDHSHVVVQGKYTKASASYTDDLAASIAQCFYDALQNRRQQIDENNLGEVRGIENQLVNFAATSLQWKKKDSWWFQRPRHINLLEMKSLLRLAERMVRSPTPLRVVNLVDSNVIRCAASKGRSSSKALNPLLRKFGAAVVAGCIYFTLPFVPTRLNTADDPTRDREVREPSSSVCAEALDVEDFHALSKIMPLRRWASNWIRLFVAICSYKVNSFVSDRKRVRGLFWTPNVHGHPAKHVQESLVPGCDRSTVPQPYDCDVSLDFDQTLGFPGEGHFVNGFVRFLHLLGFSCWICLSPLCFLCSRPVIFSLGSIGLWAVPCHGMLHPRTPGDWKRQGLRQQKPPLPSGRPVTAATSSNRAKLFGEFSLWRKRVSVDIDLILARPIEHVERVNELLITYGRRLYDSGRTYAHFVETINSIASMRPVWRRQLQPAWDLAFAWVKDERPVHHISMPWQILLAMTALSIAWGWIDVAGLLCLGFGALLRTGELTGALRKDLLLPADTLFTNNFALLSLQEPKTRFVAARHQSAKLDIEDLLAVVNVAFQHLLPHQRLWGFSAQTFRVRFNHLLRALQIPTGACQGSKSLDPGSLRPGGATWILQCSEDSELVRRRGRWINHKVMEIYIQDLSSIQFFLQMSFAQRTLVMEWARLFPQLLRKAREFREAGIPPLAWYPLLVRGEPFG